MRRCAPWARISRRRLPYVLLSLFAFAHCVISSAVSRDALIYRGVELLTRHDKPVEAIAVLKEAAQLTNTTDATLEAALGMAYHQQERFDLARAHYARSLEARPNFAPTLVNMGKMFYDMLDHRQALPYFERAVAVNSTALAPIAHYMALCYHYSGNYVAAEATYHQVPKKQRDGNYYFDFGVTLDRLGKVYEAANHFNAAIAKNEYDPRPWVNIAALHQAYGQVEDSIRNYKQALSISNISRDLRIMATTNLGIAYEQMYDIRSALRWYEAALRLVPQEKASARISLLSHIFRASRTACDWEDLETRSVSLVQQVIIEQLDKAESSTLMPFDTLLMRIPPHQRVQITRAHSDSIADRSRSYRTPNDAVERPALSRDRVCVAYMSYDFNDHPTAQLMEGLFAFHDRSTVDVVAYGYGKDDGSGFRRRLVALVGDFVNIATVNIQDSIRMIEARGVEILMDAQVHTRGTRLLIPASRPAPIVVNYLVYPGTSGASFVDYIVSDHHVTPPDILVSHFTEKLVLLPYSYQVNYYPNAILSGGRSSLWTATDENSEPDHGWFTFINFNKIDKIEPRAFGVWMAILRRVPQSRLLLLEPATRPETLTPSPTTLEIKQNVLIEAAARGVAPGRVQFVPRVLKHKHLHRHRVGGLFLDTFLYGAHSTATDALYAGVPVLTLAGDAFASRVGVSLLTNAGLPELIAFSLREFENQAVTIATQPLILRQLQHRLRQGSGGMPTLFRTEDHVRTLEEAQRVMATLHRRYLRNGTIPSLRTGHIVVT